MLPVLCALGIMAALGISLRTAGTLNRRLKGDFLTAELEVRPLRALLQREHADIVHVRSRLPAWVGVLALRGMDVSERPRLVSTVHGLNSPSRYSAVMTRGERVVCVSDTVRDYVLRHYPSTDPHKLRVIPRGIDPLAFPPAPRPDRDARAWAVDQHSALGGDGPLLLLPGRGTRLKGHADALELLARLRGEEVDARLWLPGAREAGREAYIAELEARARALGVLDALAFTPPTDRIARAYAASDLVLQLSRKPEAFGRTVVEALSCARPVLGWAGTRPFGSAEAGRPSRHPRPRRSQAAARR